MLNFDKTAIEIAQEWEISQLKIRIYELEQKVEMFPTLRCQPSEPEIYSGQGKRQYTLYAIATLDSRITRDFGMEVMVKGDNKDGTLWSSYMIDQANLHAIRNLKPQVSRLMEYLHRDFLESIAASLRKTNG